MNIARGVAIFLVWMSTSTGLVARRPTSNAKPSMVSQRIDNPISSRKHSQTRIAFSLSNDESKRYTHSFVQTCQAILATTFCALNLVILPQLSLAQDLAPLTQGELPDIVAPSKILPSSVSLNTQSTTDEAWTLVNKYYLDRTFGGNDWAKVRQQYTQQHQMHGKDEMKILSDMIQLLHDKYTRVLTPAQYSAIQKYDLIGVGVTLMPNEQKQMIVGAPPIQHSPADAAGVHVGDYVTAINGISTAGRTAFDIIDQIAQDNANKVTMTIVPRDSVPSESASFDVVLQRGNTQMKNPIEYKLNVQSDGTKVGWIRIVEFNANVKAKLEDALISLQQSGANAYVLDLRRNTGGAFQSAVEIASLFVQSDKIAIYVVDSSQNKIPFRTTAKNKLAILDAPLVIWMDASTASASEVLAGSLHDNCRAILMGKKSYGKGLIQAVYGLKNGAGLVLTVARYVTPNGTDIQGVGLVPDIDGAGIVPPNFPYLESDTARVDFGMVRSRLDPSMCKPP